MTLHDDLGRVARRAMAEQRSPFWYSRARHARHEALTRFHVNLDLEQATVWFVMCGAVATALDEALAIADNDLAAAVVLVG